MRSVLILLFACCSLNASPVSIKLEHALTSNERAWGLMGRQSLPPDTGMLFHYPSEARHRFWMFNCYFDMSVALFDRNGILREILYLKAYPEMMDPKRPVNTLEDLALYPRKDPIRRFFHSQGVSSRVKARYALEVPRGWFAEKGIGVGAMLRFTGEDGTIYLAP